MQIAGHHEYLGARDPAAPNKKWIGNKIILISVCVSQYLLSMQFQSYLQFQG